jgi:hypothetical protein
VKKILFVIGSTNQTTQMHAIASHLPEYDCYFSQFFSENTLIQSAVKTGLLKHTILGGTFRERSEEYLEKHGLKNDYALSRFNNTYDLVVMCSDLIVPPSIRRTKTIWVQEGMTDRLTWLSKLVSALGLPPYLSVGTSLNGSSNLCDIYCAASEGYKKHFASLGTDERKIVVTGMPNFDHVESFVRNDFPARDFVLVATSDIRECFGFDDRVGFIRQAVKIANGRPLIFKLHPNEKRERAIREIKENTPPNTLIYTDGNINHMIANCGELITQYSTVVYVGLALNKKVHSYFDVEELKRRMPVQNGGTSAWQIAEIAKAYIEYAGSKEEFIQRELPRMEEMQKPRTLHSAA